MVGIDYLVVACWFGLTGYLDNLMPINWIFRGGYLIMIGCLGLVGFAAG